MASLFWMERSKLQYNVFPFNIFKLLPQFKLIFLNSIPDTKRVRANCNFNVAKKGKKIKIKSDIKAREGAADTH